ncbi:MAG: signaling recognition particle receptor family protein, partial [Alphaproteobacteria bacterium]
MSQNDSTEHPDPARPPAESETPAAPRRNWLQRLRNGLGRSARGLSDGIAGVVRRRRLDEAALEELEDTLIASDLGVATASDLCKSLARARFGRDVSDEDVRRHLAHDIAAILQPVAVPLTLTPQNGPHVVLVMGVNGSGKTTTLGKLARQWRDSGRSALLVAGDTFRAAATEQLQVWGRRSDTTVMTARPGADSSGLAYDALDRARRDHMDILAIDTAGRLQDKADLMAELAKVVRVLKKLDPAAPHTTLLVLDATVGQN